MGVELSTQELILIGSALLGVLVVMAGIVMILNGTSTINDNNSLIGSGVVTVIVGVVAVIIFGSWIALDLTDVSDDEFAETQAQQLDQDKETLSLAETWLGSGKITADEAVEQLTRQIEDLRGSIHAREAELRASEKARDREEERHRIDAENDRQQKAVDELFSGTTAATEGN